MKFKKENKNINDREEFIFVLLFSLLIPITVSLIQIIISGEITFLKLGQCFVENIVPSVLAYAGVIVIQNIILLTRKKSAICRYTVISLMSIIIYSIFYAIFLVYNEINSNKILINIFSSILIGLTGLIIFVSILSFFETRHRPIDKGRRNFSGSDY